MAALEEFAAHLASPRAVKLAMTQRVSIDTEIALINRLPLDDIDVGVLVIHAADISKFAAMMADDRQKLGGRYADG